MTTPQDQTPTLTNDQVATPAGETVARRFAKIAEEAASKTGPIHMINLIRFREKAEYGADARSGNTAMSGAAAYARYSELVEPLARRVDAAVAWASPTSTVLDGPEDEAWDAVFAVRYPSRAAFLEMVTSADYQAVAHHRAAAVADSRLILTEIDVEN